MYVAQMRCKFGSQQVIINHVLQFAYSEPTSLTKVTQDLRIIVHRMRALSASLGLLRLFSSRLGGIDSLSFGCSRLDGPGKDFVTIWIPVGLSSEWVVTMMYVYMVTHIARAWINRVRLPTLDVVS